MQEKTRPKQLIEIYKRNLVMIHLKYLSVRQRGSVQQNTDTVGPQYQWQYSDLD